jgi:lysophospholipid acyltransferase (LPLAT)-like uncharacterized protein
MLRPGRNTPIPERAPRVFAAYLKLVRGTSRFDLGGLQPVRAILGERSAIVAVLHRESLIHFVCPYSVTVAVLARDQDSFGLYAQLARSFGFGMIEQIGLMPPLRKALQLLSQPGRVLVVAVDGPAGPSDVAKRGAIELARLSRAPVIPVRCFARYAVPLRTTWDRRLVPLPCGTIAPVAGGLLEVPPRATRQDIDELVSTLTATLGGLRVRRVSG